MTGLQAWLVRRWRHPTLASRLLLWPAAGVFGLVVQLRRMAYRRGWRAGRRLDVPVIVVGNLTLGGSGKTPLVLHLVAALRVAGWRAGVVSRGHGGREGHARRIDTGEDAADPAACGDEPALVHWVAGCPVAVGRDRAAAAALLVSDCDVVVADDGLQHYALARDVEIAVVDGRFGLGNGWLLPAGPLREPAGRLVTVDFIAVRDGERPGAWPITVRADRARRVDGGGRGTGLAEWADTAVHGVAGIGVPERFFSQLERAGVGIERHAFPDHHAYAAGDLAFDDNRPVLMTQKDAVKCRAFADERLWYLSATVDDPAGLARAVVERVAAVQTNERN